MARSSASRRRQKLLKRRKREEKDRADSAAVDTAHDEAIKASGSES